MQNQGLGRHSAKMCDRMLPKWKKALPGVYSPWSYNIHIYQNLFCNLIAAGKISFKNVCNYILIDYAQISEGSYIRRYQNDNSSVIEGQGFTLWTVNDISVKETWKELEGFTASEGSFHAPFT